MPAIRDLAGGLAAELRLRAVDERAETWGRGTSILDLAPRTYGRFWTGFGDLLGSCVIYKIVQPNAGLL
jgi:hypothetical protein